MIDIDYSNYDAAYRESEERYIEENYPTCIEFKDYNSSPQGAHTLDEYLVYLIKGYINVEIQSIILSKYQPEITEYKFVMSAWSALRMKKSVLRLLSKYPVIMENCGTIYGLIRNSD